ncbi:MAG: DUF1178 family protein [Rhizobiaceae bacterium]
MIRYSLVCERSHDFEAWFRNSDDYDRQRKRGLVECPECGSAKVEKALMAPSVSTSRGREKIALAMGAEQKKAMDALREMSKKMLEGAENVGDKFAEEARKIHFGETEARGIYGEATPEEAAGLVEDGVTFMPVPVFSDDRN